MDALAAATDSEIDGHVPRQSCALMTGAAAIFPCPLSLYKPGRRQSPFPSARTSFLSSRVVVVLLPVSSRHHHELSAHWRDAARPGGTAAARRRSSSPFQEVPVRALSNWRSNRAVAALPSALGEIPVPRSFRFSASGRFPWSVDRSRDIAKSSVHVHGGLSPRFTFWSCSLPSRGRRRPVSPWI